MSRAKWLCLDCGRDTGKLGEHYMLIDEVWLSIAPKVGMLCVGCAEIRLQRSLTPRDFNDSYVNRPGNKSVRLMDRMHGELGHNQLSSVW